MEMHWESKNTNEWSDLFLASGSVIGFDNNDVTITHSANLLTIAGGGVTTSGTLTADGALDSNGEVTIADTNVAFDGATPHLPQPET